MTFKEKKFNRPPGIEEIFFYTKTNRIVQKTDETRVTKSSTQLNYEIIEGYYQTLHNSSWTGIDPDWGNCFAVRLAQFLLDMVKSKRFTTQKDGALRKSFYRHCLDKIRGSGLFNEIDENELLIIYMKQCIHILRSSKILKTSGRYAEIIRQNISGSSLFFRLFKSFWNMTSWDEIFPSDAEAAIDLKYNRNILKDIITQYYGKARIDEIANEFFDITGFTSANDMVLISFLDFYLFTWLRHFGLIKYFEDSPLSPVCIEVTDRGRKLLQSIG